MHFFVLSYMDECEDLEEKKGRSATCIDAWDMPRLAPHFLTLLGLSLHVTFYLSMHKCLLVQKRGF